MKLKKFIYIAFAVWANSSFAQRTEESINSAWRFFKGDSTGFKNEVLDDKNWQQLNLPHTWNAQDAFSTTQKMYKGAAWYRKYITQKFNKNEKVFLHFEGAFQYTEVYVNGSFAGSHKGGYTAFTIDISAFIKENSVTTLAVRIDNTPRKDITPISGDFTRYGGIYRDVWLIRTGETHFSLDKFGSKGVYSETQPSALNPPKDDFKTPKLKVWGEVKNETSAEKSVEIVSELKDDTGKVVSTFKKSVKMKPLSTVSFNMVSDVLKNIQLWSPESPYLYTLETKIISTTDKKVLDIQSFKTGFRWFKMSADSGFYLNGKRLKLNGTCRHQDIATLANAMPNELHEADIKMIKEMGMNFIRIAHYPQDPALLDACDKYGVLAWEEIPVVDYIDTSKAYKENAAYNLREMIYQHRNHTSVVMWGFMNEILLGIGRYIKDEPSIKIQYEQVPALTKAFNDICKKEDASRLTTIAHHGDRDRYVNNNMCNKTDVVGWNCYPGWYGGPIGSFEPMVNDIREKVKDRAMIISEYGAGSDTRINSLQPECFDFSMQYQQLYIEDYLKVIASKPYIAGATAWLLNDFGSEIRDESMPRINNKGIVTMDRRKKDVFYLYKAAYNKEPMIHICVRDWPTRKMTPLLGSKTITNPIKVYSNLQEVSLFLNGRPVGRRPVVNNLAIFEVPFTEGINRLEARGQINGEANKPKGPRNRRMNANQVSDFAEVNFDFQPSVLNDTTLYPNLEIGVNCGSNAYFEDRERNFIWEPDQPYRQGSWGFVGGERELNGARPGTTTDIQGTASDPLYQTSRINPEAYRFDVATGEYTVELLMSKHAPPQKELLNDIGNVNREKTANSAFAVEINGQEVFITNDYESEFGVNAALSKLYNVKVNKGQGIEIKFRKIDGKAAICGIKVKRK